MTSRQKVLFSATMCGQNMAVWFAVWAITTGRPLLGIAALVVFLVMPSWVLIGYSIRESRKRAEEARRARASKSA